MLASIILFVLRSFQFLLSPLFWVLGLLLGGPESSSVPYATCGDCFCIPEAGNSCPAVIPETNFRDLIPILRSFTWNNPYTLECDPYDDPACNTEPPLVEGSACVIYAGDLVATIPPASTDSCPVGYSYKVSTYPGTLLEAKSDPNVYVTHEGQCGACSSLHDLSVYMEFQIELRQKAGDCGIIGRFDGMEAGIACFKNIGFTDACAKIWYYNSEQTAKNCIAECLSFTLLALPSNGPPPDCPLAGCLDCDETLAGPIFERVAGRTRRNSGLLSNIVRGCDELTDLVQTNPCLGVDA